MSFKGQRFANHYPLSTAVRSDRSSLGQRIFSIFGHYNDTDSIETKKLLEEHWLKGMGPPIGNMYYTQLDEVDKLTPSVGKSGYPEFTIPPITGDGTPLVEDELVEELLYGAPTRLEAHSNTSYTNLTVWESSAPNTYNSIEFPDQLWIDVYGSVTFKNAFLDRAFKGFAYVWLKGRNEEYDEIEELVTIRDDGIYRTHHFYRTLTEVRYYGFDGQVRISSAPVGLSYVFDPWRTLVFSTFESYAKLYLSGYSYSAVDYAKLSYRGDKFKLGIEYKDGGEAPFGNEEVLWEQTLLDEAEGAYVPVEMVVSPIDARLYVVDDLGFVHIYEHSPGNFEALRAQQTEDVYVGTEALRQYAALGEETKLFVRLLRGTNAISKVQVKRIAPSGATTYLQTDMTWSGTPAYVAGDPLGGLAPKTWKNRTISFTPTEFGQWEFYTTTVLLNGSTSLHCSAVLVDSLAAVASIDSGVANPTGIFFTKEGRLAVTDATDIYYLTMHRDAYHFDKPNQTFYFREYYTTLLIDGEAKTQEEILLQTGYDNVSFNKGLERFSGENMHSFRRRLLGEADKPSGASERQYIQTTGRQVGLFDVPVFEIATQSSPPDPYIEITSSWLRAYSDYENGTLDFEVELTDSTNKFLREVKTAFDGSTYFVATVLDADYTYKPSKNLRIGNSTETVNAETPSGSLSYKLKQSSIRDFFPIDQVAYRNEVASAALVLEDGDYFLDYDNGVVFTNIASRSSIGYTYRKFPFIIYWQPMKVFPLNDADVDYRFKSKAVDHDTGTLEPARLNPDGASVYNRVLVAHPMTWGK